MIETRKLRELIKLMTENDLCELDLRDKDEQVTLRRASPQAAAPAPAPGMYVPSAAAPVAHAAPPAELPGAGATLPGGVEIKSPMVGTFYASSSPDAEPFARVGSSVGPDTVVCIIEAMKVFNEIKAETSGRIEKVLVTSGQAVEFGQPLFLVRGEE
ncbi:MAG: acetyl-CoA carboxylase biotin carboxyl carrier protein [Phycisphaeraceae bacterium]